jgi:hypothetical protein
MILFRTIIFSQTFPKYYTKDEDYEPSNVNILIRKKNKFVLDLITYTTLLEVLPL